MYKHKLANHILVGFHLISFNFHESRRISVPLILFILLSFTFIPISCRRLQNLNISYWENSLIYDLNELCGVLKTQCHLFFFFFIVRVYLVRYSFFSITMLLPLRREPRQVKWLPPVALTNDVGYECMDVCLCICKWDNTPRCRCEII